MAAGLNEIDAPLAQSEIGDNSDDSNDSFYNRRHFTNRSSDCVINCNVRRSTSDPIDLMGCSSLNGSLQDLVSNFDQKIFNCFKNYDVNTQNIAPVTQKTEEELLSHSGTWWTITGNFGSFLPIVSEAHENNDVATKFMDDSVAMTSHDKWPEEAEESHLDADIANSPRRRTQIGIDFPSAEQVLSEIDEIMDLSCSAGMMESSFDSEMISSGKMELLHFKETHEHLPQGSSEWQKALHKLSPEALGELSEETSRNIDRLSERLVAELAVREDLLLEKELKEHLVALLLAIQRRKREMARTGENANKSGPTDPARGGRRTTNPAENRRRWSWTGFRAAATLRPFHQEANLPTAQFLSTVIPYHQTGIRLDIKHLQIYNKILRAIIDDNPQVNSLLTDYILKVYAPASTTIDSENNQSNYQISSVQIV